MKTVATILLSIVILLQYSLHPIKDVDWDYAVTLIGRSIVGTIAFSAMYVSVQHLPVFIAHIGSNLSPFWAALFGYCVNKEKLRCFQGICMVGCFAGIVVLSVTKSEAEDEK